MRRERIAELFIGPLGEAMLVAAVAAIGWGTHRPLLFTSLGPTAYELVERPQQRSARPWNVVAGHLLGLAAGFFALWILGARDAPKVASAGFVPGIRVGASALAAMLTVLLTMLLRATQPAALSTTLLVTLGTMQSGRDAVSIVVGVLLITILGEPVRRVRLRIAGPPATPS